MVATVVQIGVSRDQRGAVRAGLCERDVESLVDADEGPAPDCDRVGGETGIGMVVGELESRQEQEVVLPAGTLCLSEDFGEVLGVVRAVNSASRRFRRKPRIVAADDV